MAERRPIVRQPHEGEIVSRAFLRITGEHSNNRLTILGPVTLEPVPDVIERAAEKGHDTGAGVGVVFGDAREWLLARGGLGAVLRY